MGGLGGVAHEGHGGRDHPLHLVHVGGHLGADRLGDGLDAEAQAGERRAQVVGDGADHGGAVGDIAAQPVLHLVERRAGRLDLRGAGHRHRRRAGVAAQPLGRRGEGGYGRGQPPGEVVGHGRQHQHAQPEP